MGSSIIFGDDFEEKISMIDYIDYFTRRSEKITMQKAFENLLNDTISAGTDPIYLLFGFLRYSPFGILAVQRKNQRKILAHVKEFAKVASDPNSVLC